MRSRATRRRQRQLAALRTPSTYCPQVDVLVGSRGGTDHFHEWLHCIDHGATAYGHMLDRLSAIFAHGWGRLMADFSDEGLALPCPLERMFDPDGGTAAVAASGCRPQDAVGVTERLAGAAFSHDVLSGLLETFDGIEPLAAQSQVAAVNGLGLLERLCERDLTLAECSQELASLPVWQVPETVCPSVRWRAEGGSVSYPEVGARALLEGRAQLVEGRLHADPNAGFLSAVADRRPEYFVAPMLVSDCLADMGGIPDGALFDTFMALSDLALMTPVVPPYAALRRERRYRDVHPGYRFLRLLDLLPDIGPLLEGTDPFVWQQAFSDRLDWPSTRAMLEHGAALDSPHRRFQRHRRCCELKLARPELFFLGGVPTDMQAFEQLLQIMSPLECVAEESGTLTPIFGDTDVDAILVQMAESYLFDLGEAIMCSAAPLASAFEWMTPYEEGIRLSDGTGLRELLETMLVRDLRFAAVPT